MLKSKVSHSTKAVYRILLKTSPKIYHRQRLLRLVVLWSKRKKNDILCLFKHLIDIFNHIIDINFEEILVFISNNINLSLIYIDCF